MGSVDTEIPSWLHRVIEFSNTTIYELRRPLTDFRRCHDGTPAESRILFTCRRLHDDIQSQDEDLVIKIKVQMPAESTSGSTTGPSTTTSAELEALRRFRAAGQASVPHLVDFKQTVQDDNAPFPGGYMTFTVMTMMPGKTLLDGNYWKMPEAERDEIKTKFLRALRSIYDLGIQPEDCALRNILWEPETRACSIIDFELWKETSENVSDHVKEFQRWGISRRPPPRDWWAEWKIQGR